MANAAMSLRKVTGYALTKAPKVLQVREVVNYGLYSDLPKPIPSDKVGIELLLDLINKETLEVFTLSRVTISSLSPSGRQNGNTSILLSANRGSSYRGTTTLYYNRATIKRYFTNTSGTIDVPTNTTTHQLIPAINARYNCHLTPDDIIDTPVAANATGFALVAASTSYIFLPDTRVVIGVLEDPPLSSAVIITKLNGFDPAA